MLQWIRKKFSQSVYDEQQNSITLYECCLKGRLEEARQVLKKGADPNSQHCDWSTLNCPNLSCLKMAVRSNYPELVSLLLSHPRIDVNQRHAIPDERVLRLRRAMCRSCSPHMPHLHDDCVQELNYDTRTRRNALQDDRTALHHACELGHEEVLKLLLAAPSVDVNARGPFWGPAISDERRLNWFTPIQTAIIEGQVKSVYLMAAAADVDLNVKTSCGDSLEELARR